MKKLWTILTAVMFTLVTLGQTSSTVLTGTAQPPLPFNLVPEPGFENRTTGWSITSDSGTFTTATVTVPALNPDVARGRFSGKWTPKASKAAGQMLCSTAAIVPPGIAGHDCRGQMLYNGAAATNGTMVFEAYDGTNHLGTNGLSDQTGYVFVQTNTFTCPATNTQLKLCVRSTATTPAISTPLYFDEAIMADVIALNIGSSITGVGTFGTSPSTAGASISGVTLTLQPADANHPGGISTGAQSFAGAKTFTSAPTFSSLSTGVLHSGSGGAVTSSTIVNADVSASAAIDATKIANGSVSSTEFQYLDGTTSNIQSQIDAIAGGGITSLTGDVTGVGPGAAVTTIGAGKVTNAMLAGAISDSKLNIISTASKVANSATTANSANTANAIVARDSSGNFVANQITASLTGNADTATALAANPADCAAGTVAKAIAANGDLTCSAVGLGSEVGSSVLPIANGGTGSSTALTGFTSLSPQTTKGDLIGFSTTPVRIGVGTNGQFVTADSAQASGLKYSFPAWGTFTGTLSSQTDLQTALDAKLNLSGGTMSGAIAMGTNKITGMGTPTNPADAATKAYVDSTSGNPLTTKGDLFTFSSASARLPVGSDGQTIVADSASTNGIKWSTPAGGGDVTGPGSSTDNAIARFDGTTGKLLQNSSATIDDSGHIAAPQLNASEAISSDSGGGSAVSSSITVSSGTGGGTISGLQTSITTSASNAPLILYGLQTSAEATGGHPEALISQYNLLLNSTTSSSMDLYGVYLDAPNNSGSIRNYTGLYIAGVSGGTVGGTNRAIWVDSGDSVFDGNVNLSGQTASRAVAFDSSKNLVSSSTTDTELGYVHGVTSAIQTQLNAKGTVSSVGFSVPASSIFGTSGSPVTGSGTLGLTVTGTSGASHTLTPRPPCPHRRPSRPTGLC
jgi:hypothetical protein